MKVKTVSKVNDTCQSDAAYIVQQFMKHSSYIEQKNLCTVILQVKKNFLNKENFLTAEGLQNFLQSFVDILAKLVKVEDLLQGLAKAFNDEDESSKVRILEVFLFITLMTNTMIF
jgi:hypothetical protein